MESLRCGAKHPFRSLKCGWELFHGSVVIADAETRQQLHKVVCPLAPGIVHVHGEPGAHEAGRHRPAHVADADEPDAWLVRHQSLPFAPSTSLNTSVAILNASKQAGMPQYAPICSRISLISSRVTPLLSAARRWSRNSAPRLS